MQERYIQTKKELIKEQVERYVQKVEAQLQITYEIYQENMAKNVEDSIKLFPLFKAQNSQKKSNKILQDFLTYLNQSSIKRDEIYFLAFDKETNFIYESLGDKESVKIALDENDTLFSLQKKAIQEEQSKGFYTTIDPLTKNTHQKFVHIKKLPHTNLYIGVGFYTQALVEKVKNDAIATVKTLRYGNNQEGYLWIHSLNGKMIAHPIQGFLNGEFVDKYKTSDDRYCFVEMNALALEKGSGFLEYMWKYPGSLELEEKKISYIKQVANWDWVVGSGFYFREQIQAVAEEKQYLQEQLYENLITLFLIMFFIFSFTMVVAIYVNKKFKERDEAKGKKC